MYWKSESLHRHDIDALTYYSPLVLGGPHLAAVEGSSAGSSFRYGPAAGIAGLAEYVERRHFMHRVPCASTLAVRAFEAPMPTLRVAYRQVTKEIPIAEMDDSVIQATWALRYASFEPLLVPRNLVSLSDRHGSADLRLHPLRDSSGMASHTMAAGAMAGAALEFIERQTWTAAWLGAGTITRIALAGSQICMDPLLPTESQERLECYWIQGGLPAYTVFAAYFRDSTSGGASEACFSCGLAASGDPRLSLEKAITEANHYRHFAAEKRAAGSSSVASRPICRLEANSLRFQTPNARDLVPFLTRVGETLGSHDFCRLPVQVAADIRAGLTSRWPPLFMYIGHDASLIGAFFVARLFGPDFYLHSDPGVALNFDNAFARTLGIDHPAPEFQTSTCLP